LLAGTGGVIGRALFHLSTPFIPRTFPGSAAIVSCARKRPSKLYWENVTDRDPGNLVAKSREAGGFSLGRFISLGRSICAWPECLSSV
jgi:hypothetical protein